MYVGVRAGGGIGDEIEDPAGDEYELYRVVFDITFFFFVIVILLAIIQGNFVLFVDAYHDTGHCNFTANCIQMAVSISLNRKWHLQPVLTLKNVAFSYLCSITSEEDISVLQKLEKGKKSICLSLRFDH